MSRHVDRDRESWNVGAVHDLRRTSLMKVKVSTFKLFVSIYTPRLPHLSFTKMNFSSPLSEISHDNRLRKTGSP